MHVLVVEDDRETAHFLQKVVSYITRCKIREDQRIYISFYQFSERIIFL